MRRRIRAIGFVLLGASCWFLVGCSGGSGMPLVPVSGRVTFDGGPCPESGTIVFVPDPDSVPKGLPSRPGHAEFGTDGKFVVTSFKKGDGLLPGRYWVNIRCITGMPAAGASMESVSLIAPGYKPDQLVVEEGKGAVEVNYDVPPKKR